MYSSRASGPPPAAREREVGDGASRADGTIPNGRLGPNLDDEPLELVFLRLFAMVARGTATGENPKAVVGDTAEAERTAAKAAA
jgi:hypothetical protein